jgi:hypothetical protein
MVAVVLRYTALRVLEPGRVWLLEGHARRLGPGSREALVAFAAGAQPGVYRANWDGTGLVTALRGPSRLIEGMPTRLVVSPFADQHGRFPKPAPPSPYDRVREDGVATLLTDTRGEELYESCAASVLAWNGTSLVLTPESSPAVASVAEAEVARTLPVLRAPIAVKGDWPLVLINAVAGVVGVTVEGREAFPAVARAQVEEALGGPQ